MKRILFFAIVLIACGFTNKKHESEVLSCTSPGLLRLGIQTDQQNYIDAFAGYLGAVDGYQWTIQGGFITSGNPNSQSISIGVDCDVPYTGNPITIYVSVRAYNTDPSTGSICYGPTSTRSLIYSGPCFY